MKKIINNFEIFKSTVIFIYVIINKRLLKWIEKK